MTDTSLREEWRAVQGFGGRYSVSSLGRLRSTARGSTPKVLRGTRVRGYPYALIRVCGKQRLVSIHSLVAAAFIGPRPDGMVINHINGIKTDNRPCNLEYVTIAENNLHASRVLGRTNLRNTLPLSVVAGIRANAGNGRSVSSLAREFGVSRVTVSKILSGRTWKNVA